jgi:predicted small integral membrane protein
MFLTRVDFSSDGALFFLVLFVLAFVVAVLMERASPRRKKRRRIDRVGNDRGGQLID